MSVSDSDTGLEEILIDLKVIASLSQNNKLITGGCYLNIEKPYYGIPEWIRRMARGDGRDETIKRINSTVTKAITFLNSESESNSNRVTEHLTGATKGLGNLKRTYSSDTQTVARLNTVIDKIRAALRDYQYREEFDTRSHRSGTSNSSGHGTN